MAPPRSPWPGYPHNQGEVEVFLSGRVRRPLLGVVASTVALAALGSSAAFAQGQVEQGNGRSICYFSGLNDDPNEPGHEGRTQNYGQLVAAGEKDSEPSPGWACNPIKGPFDMKAP